MVIERNPEVNPTRTTPRTRREVSPYHMPRPGMTRAQRHKDIIVDLGAELLSRGEWQMVTAIDTIIRARGWQDA